MANTIQVKRGLAADLTAADPTLAIGEFAYETDTGKFKVGDGSTAWSALGYFEAAAAEAWSFQGENFGYSSGGAISNPIVYSSVIDKFSFTSDGNSTNMGNLTLARGFVAGNSSSENGYAAGGNPSTNVIDKFPFASDGNAIDIGDLTAASYGGAGQSSSENGYISGGFGSWFISTIQKFPFAADGNAAIVGNMLPGNGTANRYAAGHSSATEGYSSGGTDIFNEIQKFPFASDGNTIDVGNLIYSSENATGNSSLEYGYSSASYFNTPPIVRSNIEKFSFASNGNATDVGNLTQARTAASGQSSTTNGYVSGGSFYNIIDKFPFASDTNATDVGDLTESKIWIAAGQQY